MRRKRITREEAQVLEKIGIEVRYFAAIPDSEPKLNGRRRRAPKIGAKEELGLTARAVEFKPGSMNHRAHNVVMGIFERDLSLRFSREYLVSMLCKTLGISPDAASSIITYFVHKRKVLRVIG